MNNLIKSIKILTLTLKVIHQQHIINQQSMLINKLQSKSPKHKTYKSITSKHTKKYGNAIKYYKDSGLYDKVVLLRNKGHSIRTIVVMLNNEKYKSFKGSKITKIVVENIIKHLTK